MRLFLEFSNTVQKNEKVYCLSHFSQDSAKDAHENASITEVVASVKNPAEEDQHEVSVTIIPPELPATQNASTIIATTSETRSANERNVTVKPIKSQTKVSFLL